MSETESEAISAWRGWIEREIGGPPPVIEAAMKAAIDGIRQRRSSEEIVAAARQAADNWTAGVALPPRQEPPPAANTGRGIYDIVAADKSELGRATQAALDAIDLSVKMRAKAFFATSGFRGRYGFERKLHMPWLALILVAFVIGFVLINTVGHSSSGLRNFLGAMINLLLLAFVLRLLFVAIITPILARYSAIEIRDGRIKVTFGIFSTTQHVMEVHQISECGWSQSFIQKLLNEGSLWMRIDTASRQTYAYYVPGLVPPSQMQPYVDRLRNAAQKLRQGQGRYFPGGFIN